MSGPEPQPLQETSAARRDVNWYDEVDPTKQPTLSTANGVILNSGKFRCGICGRQMMNKPGSISSHKSNFHPKNPKKQSAYQRRYARSPCPCMYCNAIYNSSATLSSHVRKEHMEERKLAALRDPVPVISDTTKKQPTQVAEEMCPEVRTLWRSVLPHDSDEEGSGR